MKGLILTSGLGSRLRPLTDSFPKPLAPICNRPLLSLIADRMGRCGVDSLGMNLYYKPGMIRAFAEKYLETDTFFSLEQQLLGTGGGIAGFRDFLGEQDFFPVYNGDIFCDLDLKAPAVFHCSTGADATLVVLKDGPADRVRVGDDFSVVDIRGELGRTGGRLHTFTGIAFYGKRFLRMLPEGLFYSVIDFIIEKLREGEIKVNAYVSPSPFYWNDIGTPEAYLGLHRDILSLKKAVDFVFDAPVVVGEGVSAGACVSFGGFAAVGDGVRLSDGVSVRDSVLLPGARVSSSLCRAVAGKDFLLEGIL